MIDWGDEISLQRRDDGQIRRIDAPACRAESDLVVRAALALRPPAASPWAPTSARDKRIPMGGGLGGGSSMRPACWIALNRIWGCIAAPAAAGDRPHPGADVPFFVFGETTAFAEGVGEALRLLDVPPAVRDGRAEGSCPPLKFFRTRVDTG